jgi:hypothetical protein
MQIDFQHLLETVVLTSLVSIFIFFSRVEAILQFIASTTGILTFVEGKHSAKPSRQRFADKELFAESHSRPHGTHVS